VRRDEAAAQAKEEAEEQRMQEVDAVRRLAILRGEIPPPLEQDEPEPEPLPAPAHQASGDRHGHGSGRKRKRHGEDDTDFEMRLALEHASAGSRVAHELAAKPSSSLPAPPLVDSKGHISLFSSGLPPPAEKNEEAEREAARKKREFTDQYQMRLVNAAGKDGLGLTDGGPWYATAEGEASGALVPSRNVWGREDPKRKGREAKRLDASDPLAMMKRGATKVRELEKGRRGEREERERELESLEREERRRERKRRREEGGRGRERRSSPGREDRSDRRDRSYRQRDADSTQDRRKDRSKERERRRHEDGHEKRGHREDDRHHRSHKPNKDRDRHSHSRH
jgi:hypothetical protein